MKKVQIVIIFLLSVVFGYGQELPKVVPPSPNAYQMTKYGDVPVNESTGNISLNVPLFTYKAGSLSLPLNANYSGNGVRLNQESGIIGMNWSLDAGGVITRVVKGKIDELASDRFYVDQNYLANMPQGSWGTFNDPSTFYGKMYALGQQTNTTTGGTDTQCDIFSYSFLGYGGSFFFDDQQQAHLIKYNKEIKIETFFENNTLNFKITTENGVSYYFGGENATETSRNRWGQGGSVSSYTPTSFFLYKISSWDGNEIYIDYITN